MYAKFYFLNMLFTTAARSVAVVGISFLLAEKGALTMRVNAPARMSCSAGDFALKVSTPAKMSPCPFFGEIALYNVFTYYSCGLCHFAQFFM